MQGYFEYMGYCMEDEDKAMFIRAGMLQVCDDDILMPSIPCHGVCPKERKLCSKNRCLESYERKECNGTCIHRDEPCYQICDEAFLSASKLCKGECPEGRKKCGNECIENTSSQIDCNGSCQFPNVLCNGECSAVSYTHLTLPTKA